MRLLFLGLAALVLLIAAAVAYDPISATEPDTRPTTSYETGTWDPSIHEGDAGGANGGPDR